MSYFKPLSYWEQDAYLGCYDVAIIGGGIVGMNAALRLKEVASGLRVAIIERSSLGTAASSRNAGFACFGSPSEIMSDLESMSEDEVYDLINRRVTGLKLLREIVGTEGLRYSQSGGHEVFIDKDKFELNLSQLAWMNKLVGQIDPLLKFYSASDTKGLLEVSGVITNDWEGQIHPGYMTMALRNRCAENEINVLTNIHIDSIDKSVNYLIKGEQLSIASRKVIVCNNAFAKGLVDTETKPGRNQVLLTGPIKHLRIYGNFHYDSGYVYFRNVGDRLLIGGGRNKDNDIESTDSFGDTEVIRSYLKNIINRHILKDGSYRIEHSWSGILGFNETKKPIIKEVEPGKFVAVGLGGMGVAIGALVGREVADLLLQS